MNNLLEQFKDFAVNNLCVSPTDAESMCDWLRENLEPKGQPTYMAYLDDNDFSKINIKPGRFMPMSVYLCMQVKKEQGVVFPIGWDVDMRGYYE